jgi:hypothetical protein
MVFGGVREDSSRGLTNGTIFSVLDFGLTDLNYPRVNVVRLDRESGVMVEIVWCSGWILVDKTVSSDLIVLSILFCVKNDPSDNVRGF